MSAERADLSSRREAAARAKYREVEREVEREADRDGVPLERPPANGEYRGPAKVRTLPLGLSFMADNGDSPKALQSRWWRARDREGRVK